MPNKLFIKRYRVSVTYLGKEGEADRVEGFLNARTSFEAYKKAKTMSSANDIIGKVKEIDVRFYF